MAKQKTSKKSKQSSTKATKQPKQLDINKRQAVGLKRLRSWNLILAIFLLAQATLVNIYAKATYMPITINYLGVDELASQSQGHQVLAAANRQLYSVNIVLLVTAFLFISAFFHALIATYSRGRYENDIRHGVNRLRWLDYSLSSGVMLVVIGMLNGISDLASLIMIFGLVLALHLFGYHLEKQKTVETSTKRQSFFGLLCCGGAVWLVMALYLKATIIYGVGLPIYIYWINASILVITIGLATNAYLSYRCYHRWANNIFVEKVYMFLSTVAKTALVCQLFVSVLR